MTKFLRPLVLAAVVVAGTAADARATLWVRIGDGTTFAINSSGTSPVSVSGVVGPFGVIQATLTSTVTATTVTHNLSLDFSFNNPPGPTSAALTVQYYENNLSFAGLPGTVQVSTTGTTSPLAGATAQVVTGPGSATLLSQITDNTATFPPPGAARAGTTTNQTGNYNGTSALAMTPNPATTASTAAGANPFAFYQQFTVTNFLTNNLGNPLGTGHGSFRGTSTITFTPTQTEIPEPATIIGALVGLSSLGLFRLRRRTEA